MGELMDKKTAEKILMISTNCTRETNASVQKVMAQCDEVTFKSYRKYFLKRRKQISELFTPM